MNRALAAGWRRRFRGYLGVSVAIKATAFRTWPLLSVARARYWGHFTKRNTSVRVKACGGPRAGVGLAYTVTGRQASSLITSE